VAGWLVFCVSATGLGASMWENDHVTLGVTLRQPDLRCTAARFCEGRVAPESCILRLPQGACVRTLHEIYDEFTLKRGFASSSNRL
jgi:hypothetical protein